MVFHARRDIAIGDEVTHSYLSEDSLFNSVLMRQRSLQKSFSFCCTCSRCVGDDQCRGLRCKHCQEGTIFAHDPGSRDETIVEGSHEGLLGDSGNDSEDSSGVLSRWSSLHRGFVDSSCCSCGSKADVDESQELNRSERALKKIVQGWDGRYPRTREAEVVEELIASMCTQHFLANDLYAELADFYSEQGSYQLEISSLQKRCSFYKGAYPGPCAPHAWAIEALADARSNHAVDSTMPINSFESADLLRCALCGYAEALGILTLMYGSSFKRATVVQAKIIKADWFLAKYSHMGDPDPDPDLLPNSLSS